MSPRQDSTKSTQPPLFYVVDWLPPDFGAVGQYATIAARALATEGRETYLIGLTQGPASEVVEPVGSHGGVLTTRRLHARSYEKVRLLRRLLWTVSTDARLFWALLGNPKSRNADVQFTGSPPFFIYFALLLKILRRARLTYRITDFYPEAIIAHLGRRPRLLVLLERLTWALRKRVDFFEALGEDQRSILLRGGIPPERIAIKRDSAPVSVTGREQPAARPASLAGRKILLYSGNYGVAHEVETVIEGLARHSREGNARFGLWLNATGQNADLVERRLMELGVPVARTPPVPVDQLPNLLAAADAHLITLRPEFSGIVLPSKVYACILSTRPIIFVGPQSSDVHLLCSRARQRYVQVTPGDSAAFATALDDLGVAA